MVVRIFVSLSSYRDAFVAVLLVLAASHSFAQKADLAREQRLAEQIVDAILDGDAITLTGENGQKFLGIYTEAEDQPRGTVILMHGRGMHPDWEQVVQPLRVGLTERGWNTLSIQMPVLEKGRKYYDYVPIFPESFPRLEAAFDYARQQGAQRVVALAHSCSVHMTMAYVRARGHERLDAYIGVGMGATDYKQPMRMPFPLQPLTLPVLDIFGSDEYRSVTKGAPARRAIIRANHRSSRQIVVADADHYFNDQGDPLLAAVANWLNQVEWEQ